MGYSGHISSHGRMGRTSVVFSSTLPRNSKSSTSNPNPPDDEQDEDLVSRDTTPVAVYIEQNGFRTTSLEQEELAQEEWIAGIADELVSGSTTIPTSRRVAVGDKYSMPWSDVQEWALRDHLPKYTVNIPLVESLSGTESRTSPQVFALWRTMLQEVPELAGYPIDVLREHVSQNYEQQQQKEEEGRNRGFPSPQALPYLDEYSFTSKGGISGNVYGIPGLADGTRIETSAVSHVEVTLPQGFIRTLDGKAAYELGRPLRGGPELSPTQSLPTTTAAAVTAGSFELLRTVQNAGLSASKNVGEDADGMLIRLGMSTGILLAGATAINMLSHHLTVNVFWV